MPEHGKLGLNSRAAPSAPKHACFQSVQRRSLSVQNAQVWEIRHNEVWTGFGVKVGVAPGGSVGAHGVRRATFWAISDPYPYGTPKKAAVMQPIRPFLAPREGRGWVARSDFVPAGPRTPTQQPIGTTFASSTLWCRVSAIKSSPKACPFILTASSKWWKLGALSTKPWELR